MLPQYLPGVYFGPTLSIGSIVIRVDDLERQMRFWQSALGYEPRRPPSEDFVILQPSEGAGTSTDHQSEEVQRLLDLGASRR
jgi:hypothetical protein